MPKEDLIIFCCIEVRI